MLLACALARNDDFGFFGPADVRAALDRLSPGTYKDTRIERHLAHFAPAGEDVPSDGILYAEARPQGRRYRFQNPLMQPYVVLQGVSAAASPARCSSLSAARAPVTASRTSRGGR